MDSLNIKNTIQIREDRSKNTSIKIKVYLVTLTTSPPPWKSPVLWVIIFIKKKKKSI